MPSLIMSCYMTLYHFSEHFSVKVVYHLQAVVYSTRTVSTSRLYVGYHHSPADIFNVLL